MDWTGDSLYMIVGIIGTTIAPWMQFYQQASVVEKGIPLKHYAYSRLDTILGAVVVTIVCFFIVVACAATLNVAGLTQIRDAADAARALEPLAGRYAVILFSIGLANASLFAASILPLATAYSVCEGLGLEAGVNRRFSEAPEFYWLYTALIVGGAGTILLPGVPLLRIILVSQVMNGVLLPFVLVFMLILVNKRSVMGTHTNGAVYNVIAWGTGIVLVALTLVMIATSLWSGP
jgi:Mn2+/Fe2+ NRAMP family transporter